MKILKTLLIIALYELSKYVTNQIIIRKQANDDIDQPKDYEDVNWYVDNYIGSTGCHHNTITYIKQY